jgi:hypothetical protein
MKVLEAEIEYRRSRICSEIKHPRSQLGAYDKRANSKKITNEAGH